MTQLNLPGSVVIPAGKQAFVARNGKNKTVSMTLDYNSALRVLMLGMFLST